MTMFRVYYFEVLKKVLERFLKLCIPSTWYLKYFAQLWCNEIQ